MGWENYDQNELVSFIEKNLGNISDTLCEVVPGSRVFVDVNIILPTHERNFITLVTTGMSDCPIDESEEADEFKFAELIIKLPANWTLEREDFEDEKNYWPFGWIRKVAHIPHLYDGWLEKGIILPNGEPPCQFAQNTKLSCVMVCSPVEEKVRCFTTSYGRRINFYTLIPIYEEERALADLEGVEYLLKALKEKGINDVIDVSRENVGICLK